MKALVAIAFMTVLVGAAQAQQQPAAQQQAPPPAGQTCMSQHVEAPGVSAAALITRGYDIKAAVPGGLWVQKDREVYFCNSGRALDNDVLCWRLREPVKGQVCQ
ncbi:MAG TPA: hypothetical protein VF915_11425 [Reyranella sp.]